MSPSVFGKLSEHLKDTKHHRQLRRLTLSRGIFSIYGGIVFNLSVDNNSSRGERGEFIVGILPQYIKETMSTE